MARVYVCGAEAPSIISAAADPWSAAFSSAFGMGAMPAIILGGAGISAGSMLRCGALVSSHNLRLFAGAASLRVAGRVRLSATGIRRRHKWRRF